MNKAIKRIFPIGIIFLSILAVEIFTLQSALAIYPSDPENGPAFLKMGESRLSEMEEKISAAYSDMEALCADYNFRLMVQLDALIVISAIDKAEEKSWFLRPEEAGSALRSRALETEYKTMSLLGQFYEKLGDQYISEKNSQEARSSYAKAHDWCTWALDITYKMDVPANRVSLYLSLYRLCINLGNSEAASKWLGFYQKINGSKGTGAEF